MNDYTGYTEVELSQEELAKFYETKTLAIAPIENHYYILKCDGKIVDKQCYQKGEFRPIKNRGIDTFHLGKLVSKNLEQDFAFDMLQDKEVPIKIIAGRYGSGKSLLEIAHALELLERGKIDKIVFIRNNIELKDTTPLGSLPGTADEKMLPWLNNFGDHLGGMEAVRMMVEKGQIEIAPLGYVRGRDFKRCIIFVDECENLTVHQCQLLIGRIGEDSQLWMAGDRRQTDKAVFDRDSGMAKMIERLAGNELFSYVYLPKSERSKAAALADLLD